MTNSRDPLINRLKRGDVLTGKCPSRALLRHVTSQWGVLVLVVLLKGTLRYSEIKQRVGGISEKMLAQTLRILETDGVIHRTVHPVVPPHVDYRLTDAGEEIARRIAELVDWIETHSDMLLDVQPHGSEQ